MSSLAQISPRTIFRVCKNNCKESCRAQNENAKNLEGFSGFDIKACIPSCATDCFSRGVDAELGDLRNAINSYTDACAQSIHSTQSCERKEAKKYCNSQLLKPFATILPPKNILEFTNLKKAFKVVFKQYSIRYKDIEKEIKETGAKIRKKVNEKLECEVMSSNMYLCDLPLDILASKETINEYIEATILIMKNDGSLEKAGCGGKNTPTPGPTYTPTPRTDCVVPETLDPRYTDFYRTDNGYCDQKTCRTCQLRCIDKCYNFEGSVCDLCVQDEKRCKVKYDAVGIGNASLATVTRCDAPK